MKTIINDRDMIYNVNPLKKMIVDGSLQYILGYSNDYEMKESFRHCNISSYYLSISI